MGGTDLFRLDGRIAMVTGASRGLGRATAIGLAAAGASVVLCARDRTRLEEVAEKIRQAGGEASTACFDLADLAAVERAVPELIARHGRLDILVNNGGISGWSGLTDSTLGEWQTMFDVNVTAMYLLAREAAKPMTARRWGRIINFGSYVSAIGRERLTAYAASKHAVAGLTRSVAGELARHNVTCNAIAPGFFDTDMAAPTVGDPERSKVFRSAIAMGRFGDPAEIVGAAIFLASDASSYITGQILHVDGGVANVLSLPVTVAT
ncbi:MAG: 3-oxoacyl-ACP reductase FabG [Sphingomonadaceae bacterium]|nr:3-oxoacyl-ACP reductase FabG [Sphingomonadaceae bacterium]